MVLYKNKFVIFLLFLFILFNNSSILRSEAIITDDSPSVTRDWIINHDTVIEFRIYLR